jgi:hypothetical protein
MMSKTGICDLCNDQIDRGCGYVLYSDTIQPPSSGKGDVGLMHLCDTCTSKEPPVKTGGILEFKQSLPAVFFALHLDIPLYR